MDKMPCLDATRMDGYADKVSALLEQVNPDKPAKPRKDGLPEYRSLKSGNATLWELMHK